MNSKAWSGCALILASAAILACRAPSDCPNSTNSPNSPNSPNSTGAADTGEDAAPPDLAYEVELVREPELRVRISLATRAAPGDSTTFSLDEGWGGVQHVGQNIRELAVRDSRGEPLAVEQPSEHEWRVHPAPDEELRVTYALPANDRQSSADPSVHYAPILNPKLFHMIGNLGLVKPEHLSGDEPRAIRFAWKGFDSAGWKVASSFAARVRGIVIEGRTAEIDPRTFEPCLVMRTETLGPYQLGFDFEASRRDKVVRGVGPGTRAYAAGLRDGEPLRACSIHGNQPEVPVEVEVGEGEARRKITWLPEGESVPVPQFSVHEGATSSDCAGL